MSVEHPGDERGRITVGNATQGHRRPRLSQFRPKNSLEFGLGQAQRQLSRALSRLVRVGNHALGRDSVDGGVVKRDGEEEEKEL